MYAPVAAWLHNHLSQRFKGAKIWTGDTHAERVSSVLAKRNLARFFPEAETFEVKVDILGVIVKERRAFIALAECKIKAITLMDLSQIIGYAKIIKPAVALIASPEGWSQAVDHLINTFNRSDILEYQEGAKVILAQWDFGSNSISYGRTLPQGYLSTVRAFT